MPVDEPAASVYETLRRGCLTNPTEAKQQFMRLLEGDKPLLNSVLSAASGPDGTRVRSMIARAVRGHAALPTIRSVLEQWQQSERDEFTRMAIADALASSSAKAHPRGPKLTNDLPELSRTYEFLSRRLRHRVLNVLPRTAFSADRVRDALIDGRDATFILPLLDDLKATLRNLEKVIDQIAEEGDFEPTEVRLTDWLRRFALRFKNGRTDVQVAITTTDELPGVVLANGYLLDVIFRNLWNNSVQSAPTPCQIMTRVSVSLAEVLVTVVDNGPGLTSDAAISAFQFQYSSSSDPKKGRGHLEVADAIGRLMGTAAVEEIAGQGLRVVLRFRVR
jgi:signal transduction histidine kinase